MDLALTTDAWFSILQSIEDHDPKNVVVFQIWLMQTSKFLESIVRAFFRQRGIKPFELIIKGEMRYGVSVKRSHHHAEYSETTYQFVHKRNVVSLTLVFDTWKFFHMINYTCSDYSYRIALLTDDNFGTAERLPMGSEPSNHTMYFDGGKLTLLNKVISGSDGSVRVLRPSRDDPEFVAIVQETREIRELSIARRESAAKELFGASV